MKDARPIINEIKILNLLIFIMGTNIVIQMVKGYFACDIQIDGTSEK